MALNSNDSALMATKTKQKAPAMQENGGGIKSMFIYGGIFCCIAFFSLLRGQDMPFSVLSLLPVSFTVIAAILSRRALEPLLGGVIAGILLLDPASLFSRFGNLAVGALSNDTIVWIILVCGMMSGIIVMLERGGSMRSFGHFLTARVKTRRGALLTSSALGLMIFIDDYLSALAVSSSMKSTTDRFRISREKLSFIVDSTAVPVCILAPVSTWAVFFTALLEDNNLAAPGDGIMLYIESIPYMFYGWLALLLVWLVAMGYVKDFSGMRRAELNAQEGEATSYDSENDKFDQPNIKSTPSVLMGLLNFFLPLIVLVAASIYFDIDLLLGTLVACVFTITFYMAQSLLRFGQLIEAMLDGFRIMLLPFAIITASYMLKEVNDSLGMTAYVFDSVVPYLNKEFFAAIMFVVMAVIIFATSSAWGMFVIAMPIIVPLAQGVDASMPLVIGAVISASAFGCHACFFDVSTLLSARGSGCTSMQHALTQLPYTLIAAAMTILLLLFAGFLLP